MSMTDAGTTQDNFILSAPPVGGLPIHGPIAPRANVLTTELHLAPETDKAPRSSYDNTITTYEWSIYRSCTTGITRYYYPRVFPYRQCKILRIIFFLIIICEPLARIIYYFYSEYMICKTCFEKRYLSKQP